MNMGKYTGICLARQATVKHTTGDMLEPEEKELHGISTTLPMPCEKFICDGEVFVDVFMPQAGNTWIGFSGMEFDRQFLVVQGWLPEPN